MNNIFKHFATITKHRHKVIRHCFKVDIGIQGLFHDLSKYSLTEFVSGVKNYQGTRSPNEAEREKKGYSVAWLHHKGRNKHHFEYWVDYNQLTRRQEPIEMPLKYVKEMFCDRVAASKIYMGDKYTNSCPLEYFLRSKDVRIIHKNTSALLESWLLMLSKKGEKETFKYIRHYN